MTTVYDIDIHVNDIGTNFTVTVKKDGVIQDISGAVEEKIIFGRPNNTALICDAELLTDGKDGKILYSTLNGDLSMAGTWRLQAWIKFNNGSWYTGQATFMVDKNIAQVTS